MSAGPLSYVASLRPYVAASAENRDATVVDDAICDLHALRSCACTARVDDQRSAHTHSHQPRG
jgi:hypothetical protein